jgi:aspartate--ammonia ligase
MVNNINGLWVPEGYDHPLDIRETELAIKLIKDYVEHDLASKLNLTRVSAPLFVRPRTGLNDNLNGTERPVAFEVKCIEDELVEVVHSLAKWKRNALKRYGFNVGEGLYTDMNAIRRDEDTDNLHSIYVDQWDWEKSIRKEDRNEEKLKDIVNKIYRVIRISNRSCRKRYISSLPRIWKTVIPIFHPREEKTGFARR